MRRRHPPWQEGPARAKAGAVARTIDFSPVFFFLFFPWGGPSTCILPPPASELHQQLTTPNNQVRSELAPGVSSVALRFWGAPSKRDRGFIRFGRPHLASSLLTVKNASIVRSSAQRRSVLFSLPFGFSSSSSSI